MVFANLSTQEKDAFFSLLDEYFASRPEIFNSAGPSGIEKEISPAATAAAGRFAASAMHNAFSKSSNASHDSEGPPIPRWKNPSASNSDSAASSDTLQSSVGRVAARAAAFNFSPRAPNNSTQESEASAPPRPPARRISSNNSDSDPPPTPARKGLGAGTTGKLVQQKKFGDVDLSSGKNMFVSLRNSTANKSATPSLVAPPTPAAFPPKQNNYAPPPVRRVTSTSSRNETKSTSPVPPPAPPRRKEVEPEGEWAEALYDYVSEDPDDLPLEENQRVLVVDRISSDDWWIGEVDGRRGDFPAAYVKLL